MTTSEIAAQLIADGWAVVPVRRGKKQPSATDWVKREFTAADVQDDDNIGVKCGERSAHRVDVDLDCDEAVRAAADLLPLTRTHGRSSRPDSHYWYQTEGATKRQFTDIDDTVLLEIRSGGQQTVVPPSTHPSGDVLTWGEPLRPILPLTADDLTIAVVRVAMTVLLARHWPAGNRHALCGPLGGVLARLQVPAVDAERITQIAARLAGDEEARDRARFVRETVEKHAAGEQTTGGPSFEEHWPDGAAVLERLRKWAGLEENPAAKRERLEELNERHFVTPLDANVVVGIEGDDPREPVKFQRFTDFEQRYFNSWVGKQKTGRWWLEHPDRRTYAGVVFAPPPREVDEGVYNLWRGFACAPSDDPSGAHCAQYLAHIRETVCSGEAAQSDWVLDFMADAVQSPGRVAGKALVLRGRQGTGKSLTFEAFAGLFGSHAITVSSSDELVGAWNAHLSGKVVIFADEAMWGGNRGSVGTFKRMITQPTIIIKRKYLESVSEPNCGRVVMATNEKWAAPAGDFERRLVVLDVNGKQPQAYFDALWAEIEASAFQPALLAFLMARKINMAALRVGFQTSALREQQDFTADPAQQWWKQALVEGTIGERGWPDWIPSADLYAAYVEDMGSSKGAGHTHRGTRLAFMARLRDLWPDQSITYVSRRVRTNTGSQRSPNYEKRVMRCANIPDLTACRQAYDEATGSRQDWPTVDVEQGTLLDDHEEMYADGQV